ncbi:hypothetical protein [Legionella micdadei]|uniref:Predicted archaeal membrane protein n=1 Tax=Legionella micdadei TaxID=451 RepID=A0A098GEX4_LEGMI|nr:hypothetical protein [Legionella micdadei]ARG97870.1 hypothetical protein B6N58_09475 [Legionella micdadei]ARG99811.1 hypothetical protein B6V88_04935 [Legionella micdadei]KTD28587.1 membrane protein [Legionella micdadei]NSL19180.1 hypothetical protein [Legionella micdadei]CEG60520.1 Predicted archaeal membrane protein [Legionella micdadei]
MVATKFIEGRLHTVIPLSVRPNRFYSSFTVTATTTSRHAGTVIYGSFKAQFLLPNGDCLLLFANHNNNTTQLLLITHDAEKLRYLPGKRNTSIVADAISQLNRYRIRSDNYSKPRTDAQVAKYQLTNLAINQLEELLDKERELTPGDWEGQEELRREVLAILGKCNEGNLLLATNPVVSSGELGRILYEAYQSAQHYQFNRVHPVCRIDQLDFTEEHGRFTDKPASYVWDSELHIGNDEAALQDTLRVICQLYGLRLGSKLTNIPANRFARLGLFLRNLWTNSRELINYLASPLKPTQPSETTGWYDGMIVTKIKPHYYLEGLPQIGYTAEEIAEDPPPIDIRFFEHEGLHYPLPSGDDLVAISELSGQHLYLHQRISLQLKAFFSKLPAFFVYVYRSIAHFISHNLYKDFLYHIHGDHPEFQDKKSKTKPKRTSLEKYLISLQEILQNEGLLANGQTLEQFIETQIENCNYVMVREKHPPSPPMYDNPLHRSLDVFRHISSFFVDISEKNPIIGTLALAAYVYGAGAIIAPQALTALLTKLQLKGLIAGIQPTQALGQWMSHGTISEAISAAVTYWQGVVIGGDLDKFFVEAIKVLKDHPAEVAIISALAVMLGFGLCKAIPALEEEMGEFPYINYAFLGLKGGIAINDTVMHPGDDWLLGTIKWLLRGGFILLKFLLGPFIEGYYYGEDGFASGLTKSWHLLIRTIKQSIAALADLLLVILTIPLLEISSMFIHVPFRGITNFLSKTLSTLGNWQALGNSLLEFSPNSFVRNYFSGFRLSPLYGFHSPFGTYVNNRLINVLINGAMIFIYPPLQLVKNFIILPAIDLTSLVVRSLLTCLHPLVKILTFSTGSLLKTCGFLWDNSCGLIFQLGAKGISLSANWAVRIVGKGKQRILGEIQILRLNIYDWAFNEEDIALHTVNDDKEYFMSHPESVERFPHEHEDSTNCLLKALTGDKLAAVTKAGIADMRNYNPLFTTRTTKDSAGGEQLSSVMGIVL